jgi:flagella basal body P-ring formation protein FlgA
MIAILPLMLATAIAPSAQTAPAVQRVSAASLRSRIEVVIGQRLREAASTARIVAIDGVRDQIVPAGLLRVDVGVVAGRWPRARAGVPVRVMVADRHVRTLTAWVALRDVRTVQTYAAPLSARTSAIELRLIAGDVDMTCCDGVVVEDVAMLSGFRMRRSVRAGEPVLMSDFEPMPDVAERQAVGIEVQRGAVRLTTVGIALADARIGEIVSVRPDASAQVVRARVIAKQKVILDEQTQ